MHQATSQADTHNANANVGQIERWASGVGGMCLAVYGLSSRDNLARVVLPVLGGMLAYRGWTGHCHLYHTLGISTAHRGERSAMPAGMGLKVEHAITVSRPASEVFRFWRRFEQLPRFMSHLQEVKETGGNRSHWVAKAPMGMQVSWDAEIINEKTDELIAWRSLPGSMVETAGSVHFIPHGSHSTEVRVVLKYNPPAGQLGGTVASWLGESPETQVRDDLQNFKRLIESQAVLASA